jgi:DNA-directed RNA polymerase specialized sigma24 family protein
MKTKGTPAKALVRSPEANEAPADALETPVVALVAPAPNLSTPLAKEEIVGTLSGDARFTGREEPGPNMNRVEPLSAHARRVASVEVQVAIRSRLRNRGVWLQSIEDIAQDVTAELLGMADPPDDMEGCLAAARKAANEESIDTFRKGSRRGRTNAGPTANADLVTAADHASPEIWHPIDRGRQIALVREKLDDGSLSPRDAKLLVLDAEGADAAAIGRELKLAPQTVRNALSRAKGIVRAAWKSRLKGPVVVLALLILAWWMKREHDRQALDDQRNVHQDAPFAPAMPTPLERADKLRQDAWAACHDSHWVKCAEALDEAKKLDPAGETRPEVQKMRGDIVDGMRLDGPKTRELPGNP